MKKIAVVLPILIVLLLGGSCKKDDTLQFGREFTLRPNQSAQLGTLQVTLVELVDKRCPSDVYCIHGGWAWVRVRLSEGTSSTEICLGCLDGKNPSERTQVVAIRGKTYEITLKAIAPKASQQAVETVDVTFVVTRK